RRDADALRNDLRALRALGLAGGPPEPPWASQSYERPRAELPGVLFRLAAESALIIAVAVIAGVAHLHSSLIVALMAGAFVIVALSEWLATRARFVPPAVAVRPALPRRKRCRREPPRLRARSRVRGRTRAASGPTRLDRSGRTRGPGPPGRFPGRDRARVARRPRA